MMHILTFLLMMFFRGDLWRSQKDGEMEGGFSQNWPQHFQVLGLIVKHHENLRCLRYFPRNYSELKDPLIIPEKDLLKFPRGELYFPSKTTRAKVCRLRWRNCLSVNISSLASWAVFVMYYLYVYLLIYTYLIIFTYTHAYYIHCNVWYCMVL